MTDILDTSDAPLSRTPARFFFETGFFAAYAEASIQAGHRPPFDLTDAIVDRAWEIAPEAHPDRREFDRYLSSADSADKALIDAEAAYRAHWTFERESFGSREELATCAENLRRFGGELFPANRNGQAHFARVIMDTVANSIDAALTRLSTPLPDVDELAARLSKADGLDWAEVCAMEAGADHCDSSTCVAAFFEDHTPEYARAQYRSYARTLLGLPSPKRDGEAA